MSWKERDSTCVLLSTTDQRVVFLFVCLLCRQVLNCGEWLFSLLPVSVGVWEKVQIERSNLLGDRWVAPIERKRGMASCWDWWMCLPFWGSGCEDGVLRRCLFGFHSTNINGSTEQNDGYSRSLSFTRQKDLKEYIFLAKKESVLLLPPPASDTRRPSAVSSQFTHCETRPQLTIISLRLSLSLFLFDWWKFHAYSALTGIRSSRFSQSRLEIVQPE